jgi:capsular exopolysaccharide synthesis family protein
VNARRDSIESEETPLVQVDIPGSSTDSSPSDTAQVKKYLRALKRRWPILVAAVFVGALLGWVTTAAPAPATERAKTGPYYRATHTLIVDDAAAQANATNGNSLQVSVPLAQAAFFVTTGDVPSRVAARLQIPVDQVVGNVKGTALDGVSSLTITAIGTDPDRAVALADTSADELTKALADANTQKYNQTRDSILSRLDSLKSSQTDIENQIQANPQNRDVLNAQLDSVVNQYRVTYEQFQQLATVPAPTAGLRTIEAATAIPIEEDEYNSLRDQNLADPSQPTTTPSSAATTSSKPASSIGPASAPTRAATGAVLGLALALALIWLLDKFDTRLRQRVEVEAATQLPVITEIPPLPRARQNDFTVIAEQAPRSRASEAYRIIRTSLLFSWTVSEGAQVPGGKVVMVTSPSPNEGKTTTTANLAAVLAEGGMSVLVVNCDFRRPRIQRYLSDPVSHVERSIDVMGPDGAVRVFSTRIGHVDLVSGFGEQDEHANPLEIVSAQKRTVEECRAFYDVVLLDTAPFLTTNDASELLAETDALIVVVRSGKTKREAAARTAELLRRLDTNVLGVVFNGSSDSSAADYYYHYYLDDANKRRRSSAGGRSASNGSSRSSSNGNGNGNGAIVTSSTSPAAADTANDE